MKLRLYKIDNKYNWQITFNHKINTMQYLPAEILTMIIEGSSKTDLLNLRLACKMLKDIADSLISAYHPSYKINRTFHTILQVYKLPTDAFRLKTKEEFKIFTKIFPIAKIHICGYDCLLLSLKEIESQCRAIIPDEIRCAIFSELTESTDFNEIDVKLLPKYITVTDIDTGSDWETYQILRFNKDGLRNIILHVYCNWPF